MPSTNKGKKLKQWTVAQKMEVVEARRKGLTIEEVQKLFGVCTHALYKWVDAYETGGLTALEQTSHRGGARSPSPKVQAAEQLLESVTKAEPQAGIAKVQGALYRRGFLNLAKETVRKLLMRQGKAPQSVVRRRRNLPPKIKTFERAAPNDLWQTDIMTFMIKGQYRVYVIAFLDDHSRFIVGWGLHRFQTTAHVLEVFRAALEKHGAPKEVLSDNGRQYYTWRGKSQFTVFLTKLGIRHIRSRPYHPQTLGKVESFWRNLLQESLQSLPLSSFEEAQAKIGEYVEYYNFKRPHQGIANVTPSDRYFRVEAQVRQIIEQNTAKVQETQPAPHNYRPPAYIVGSIGGRELRVVAREAEVMLSEPAPEEREMVNSASPIVSQENKTEADNGAKSPSQAGEPNGENGADTPGDSPAVSGPNPLPSGGSIPGIVLPLDEESPQGGALGPGNPVSGAQDGSGDAPSSIESSGPIPGPGPVLGAGPGQNAQGEGALQTPFPNSPEDHPKEGLGTDPQDRG